ncbi:hypothetical protein UT300007_12670 [Clostridium sp. CTA-7]
MDTIKALINIFIDYDYFNNNPYFTRGNNNASLGVFYYASIDNLNIIYFATRGFLQVSASITKFLYDNNHTTLNIEHLSHFFKKVNLIIKFLLRGYSIPKFQSWNLTRLDLAANYICSSMADKAAYIEYLKTLKYSRAEKTNYDTSIHAHNKSFCYNFYDKNEEARKHNISINDNILRIEFQLKNPYLYRNLKNIKTVGSILSDQNLLNNLFKSKLDTIGLTIRPTTTNSTINSITTLTKEHKITTLLSKNIMTFLNCNLERSISSATLYRYKNILKEFGLNINSLPSKIYKYIDFNNFQLFTTEYTNSLSLALTLKYLRLLLLLLEEFIITTNYNITLPNYYICKPNISIDFLDDS